MNITKEHFNMTLQIVNGNIYSQSTFDILCKDVLIKILEYLPKDNWKNCFLTCKKFQNLTRIPRIYNSFFLYNLQRIMDCSHLKNQDLNCSSNDFFSHTLNATADLLFEELQFFLKKEISILTKKNSEGLNKPCKLNCEIIDTHDIPSLITSSISYVLFPWRKAIKKNDVTKIDLISKCQKEFKKRCHAELFDDLIRFYILDISSGRRTRRRQINIQDITQIIQEKGSHSNIDIIQHRLHLCIELLKTNEFYQCKEDMLTFAVDFFKKLEKFNLSDSFYMKWGEFFQPYLTERFIIKYLKDLSSIAGDQYWQEKIQEWKGLEQEMNNQYEVSGDRIEKIGMSSENYLSILEENVSKDEETWKETKDSFLFLINITEGEDVIHYIYCKATELGWELLKQNKEFGCRIITLLPENSEYKKYLLEGLSYN